MKALLTAICFVILGICYWILSDENLWWRIPFLKKGMFELLCFILCGGFCLIFVATLLMN